MGAGTGFQQQLLDGLWQQGLGGLAILGQLSSRVDAFIAGHFEAIRLRLKSRGAIAVIALGGYGRRELYPYSDIDLLLLHDRSGRKVIREVAEALLYPLWDAGFEVGHSVRGVKDAVDFARTDFPFQVSLLDARLIAGSGELFVELLERYARQIMDGHRHTFVRTMESHRAERRSKYGSHSFLLEPHIKEGKGGLRDIQAMMWIAKGVFGLADLAAIQSSAMLEAEDREAFETAWSTLAKVRMQLHLLCRRKNDHLIFDYQEEVARILGYLDTEGMRGVEHFMRDVYRHLQTVSVVTDLFFEHVGEVLDFSRGPEVPQQLERSIVFREGSIRLVSATELRERPYLLMRLFLQAGRHGVRLHYLTRRQIASHLDLVDESFQRSKRVAGIFLELLTETDDILPVLEAMLVTGLLPRYLPEFAGVESLAQHDLYHLYTVDRHQLQTMAELVNLRREMADVFAEVNNEAVLCLAALLHDIGKGRQTDHSKLGAEMVRTIGERLWLDEKERETLSFLIRHHLYLPENALRRDFSDRQFIRQAAQLIGDEQRLTMLYLLTIADSRATGPSAWSAWKASLLSELYLSIKACMAATCQLGEEAGEMEAQGVVWLREQIEERLAGQEAALAVASLPADYLLSFTPEAVLEHLAIHREQGARLLQQVLLFPRQKRRSWSLLIMCRDRVGLLAKFCGVLALHNLSVRAAEIFTWPDGTVVDTLEVAPPLGHSFEEIDWRAVERDFNLAVNYRLDVGYQLHLRLDRQVRANRPVQQLVRKVLIDNETSAACTIVEVHGGDSRGTLYQLTQTLADFGLSIQRAKIATEVEQLIDVFYVKTTADGKLTETAAVEKVRMTLMRIIGAEEAEPETAG